MWLREELCRRQGQTGGGEHAAQNTKQNPYFHVGYFRIQLTDAFRGICLRREIPNTRFKNRDPFVGGGFSVTLRLY